jgi:hypothetical protein
MRCKLHNYNEKGLCPQCDTPVEPPVDEPEKVAEITLSDQPLKGSDLVDLDKECALKFEDTVAALGISEDLIYKNPLECDHAGDRIVGTNRLIYCKICGQRLPLAMEATDKTLKISVPKPNTGCEETSVMSMLAYVMDLSQLNHAEQKRVAEWFLSRYQSKEV